MTEPRSAPYLPIACAAYSEHDGLKRHVPAGSAGDTNR